MLIAQLSDLHIRPEGVLYQGQIDLKFRPNAEPTSHAGPRGFTLHLWDPAHGLVSHTCEVGAHQGPYPFA